jgi:N-acyl homoserine lactone hydrolase
MRIHAIQTGTVRVKRRERNGAGRGRARLLLTLADRAWTQPLPIHAWAIEHAEGVIVVDTGETARAAAPGYFPRWHPYFRLGWRGQVTPDQEIGPQLQALGLPPNDVRLVVLTHLHTDHAGGLHHFRRSEILVARRELEAASGLGGRIDGYLSNRLPSWFRPRAMELPPEPFGPFSHSLPLTEAGDVVLVGTPGHTRGHLSVVVLDGETSYFIAGDTSYTEELMARGVVDGVTYDEKTARVTLERIRAYADARPTVYLPSHDPESAARLAERRIVSVSSAAGAALASCSGYIVEASDGRVGEVEMPLFPPDGPEPDFLVLRADGLLSLRRPLVATELVEEVDHCRHRIRVRGTRSEIESLPERLPLAM